MSSSLNRVMLMGNLTRDPNVRNASNGTPYADFAIAINENYVKDGQKMEKTVFVDVVAWDRQASACGEHLHKGSAIFVEGKLQFEEWNDKESGAKRSRLKVRADRVHFLSPPKERSAGSDHHAEEDDEPPPRARPGASATPPSRSRPPAMAR